MMTHTYVRQGEWVFLPMPMLEVPEQLVLRNEALGPDHVVQFAYRESGETVYVHERFPQGLREKDYRNYLERHPGAARWRWSTTSRSRGIYGRGMVRHPDHKTIYLRGWHRVEPTG